MVKLRFFISLLRRRILRIFIKTDTWLCLKLDKSYLLAREYSNFYVYQYHESVQSTTVEQCTKLHSFILQL